MTSFGVHTGVQNTTVSELRDLWAGAEELGFDAISVWVGPRAPHGPVRTAGRTRRAATASLRQVGTRTRRENTS